MLTWSPEVLKWISGSFLMRQKMHFILIVLNSMSVSDSAKYWMSTGCVGFLSFDELKIKI